MRWNQTSIWSPTAVFSPSLNLFPHPSGGLLTSTSEGGFEGLTRRENTRKALSSLPDVSENILGPALPGGAICFYHLCWNTHDVW